MDGETAGREMVLKSKRKWFWVGMVIALFLPPVPGFIFGFSLLTEKPYRTEALIIIGWTLVWWVCAYWVGYHILSVGAQLLSAPNGIQ